MSSTAFQIGKFAFECGHKDTENPYPPAFSGVNGRSDWFRGWWFAWAAAQENKKEVA